MENKDIYSMIFQVEIPNSTDIVKQTIWIRYSSLVLEFEALTFYLNQEEIDLGIMTKKQIKEIKNRVKFLTSEIENLEKILKEEKETKKETEKRKLKNDQILKSIF